MKKQTKATLTAYIIQAVPYLLLLAGGTMIAFFVPQAPTKVAPRTLGFAERVSYQRAIEEVYWRHRIWPEENPGPKPSLDAVMSQAELEKKVEGYLRNSQALADYYHAPLSAEQLQTEMERMASHSKQPEVLRELFASLGDDPSVVAECLARPVLAERMITNLHATPAWTRALNPNVVAAATVSYTLPKVADGGNGCTDDTWAATGITNAPEGRQSHTGVWTGTEMIVWGGSDLSGNLDTGGRYNPSTDSWLPTSTINAPAARNGHIAIWTGTEMIVWGGGGSNPNAYLNTGGRYNPATDSWTPTSTSGAPAKRSNHTGIWTGTEMIVWGGFNGGSALNTGGRYNPNTDSWTKATTINAPSGRIDQTAVWTGSEMIIWGGYDFSHQTNTGGRYNPATDTWMATTARNAPHARQSHTAVWTGTEMIVWGGIFVDTSTHYVNTGGRYDPFTDSWVATNTASAPSARSFHTAIWTGGEMIIWGGSFYDGNDNHYFNTGGRYSPFTDSWTATSTVNAPSERRVQVAVWTGSQMIIWGGFFFDTDFHFLNTGGKYCADVGPTPTPTPAPITLQGQGEKVQGMNTTYLTWSGATTTDVDVYRDSVVIATTANDGLYVDSIGNGNQADYTYLVCEAASQTCSNAVVVSFEQSIDATWSSSPVSGAWNNPRNWIPNRVPNGPFARATFNASTITDISLSGAIAVKDIIFKPGASAFTITIPAKKALTLTGTGVINNSGREQNFAVTGGTIMFEKSATAGSHALYSCNGAIHFVDSASAGKSMFVFSGGTIQGHAGAGADFRDSSSGADATFILEPGTVAGAYGGSVSFDDGQVSAGNAIIIANGATVAGAKGGEAAFFGILPSEPTLIGNGGVNGGTGGVFQFFEDIPGNLAHVQLNGDAFLDISISGGVTIGSLAGKGAVDLGDFTLTVGGDNANTRFSGLLENVNTEGYGGSIKKIGTGVLRLTHANMYENGTTVAGGALVLENRAGSGSGSGDVTVQEGTLGGNGIISGGVTIGTGSGAGAFLAPSVAASQPRTLTLNHTTFRADSTYSYRLNSKKAKADEVIANGVTIETGAQFDFNAIGNQKLAAGTVFTALSNTSSTPISGTFANLPDGSSFTAGPNSYQASYEGGDGNDLTLTVVP